MGMPDNVVDVVKDKQMCLYKCRLNAAAAVAQLKSSRKRVSDGMSHYTKSSYFS